MAEQTRKNSFVSWEGAFTPGELDSIEGLGDRLVREQAELAIKNGADERVRASGIAAISHSEATNPLFQRLAGIVRELNDKVYKFDVAGIEALRYTVYRGAEAGHYDWQIDYDPNTPQPRKLTLCLQLTEPTRYQGCDLQFQAGPRVGAAPKTRGTVIVFPSFFLHRVTPILSGTRKALTAWAVGPEFR